MADLETLTLPEELHNPTRLGLSVSPVPQDGGTLEAVPGVGTHIYLFDILGQSQIQLRKR